MTYYIDKDELLNMLASEAGYQKNRIATADGPDEARKRRHAHTKLDAINRIARLVGAMGVTVEPGEKVLPAPPKHEWDDRCFLAIALSESKPGARSAVTRAFGDMHKPVDLLHREFAEQHRRKLAAKTLTDAE